MILTRGILAVVGMMAGVGTRVEMILARGEKRLMRIGTNEADYNS